MKSQMSSEKVWWTLITLDSSKRRGPVVWGNQIPACGIGIYFFKQCSAMKMLKIREQHYLKCVFGRFPWQQCKYLLLSETKLTWIHSIAAVNMDGHERLCWGGREQQKQMQQLVVCEQTRERTHWITLANPCDWGLVPKSAARWRHRKKDTCGGRKWWV